MKSFNILEWFQFVKYAASHALPNIYESKTKRHYHFPYIMFLSSEFV